MSEILSVTPPSCEYRVKPSHHAHSHLCVPIGRRQRISQHKARSAQPDTCEWPSVCGIGTASICSTRTALSSDSKRSQVISQRIKRAPLMPISCLLSSVQMLALMFFVWRCILAMHPCHASLPGTSHTTLPLLQRRAAAWCRCSQSIQEDWLCPLHVHSPACFPVITLHQSCSHVLPPIGSLMKSWNASAHVIGLTASPSAHSVHRRVVVQLL